MFNLQKLEVDAIIAGVIILIIIGLGFGTYYYHGKYVDSLVTNGQLKAQNTSYLATINADSAANAKLAADSLAREKAAAIALKAAKEQARAFQKKASDILASQAAYPTDMCKSADALYDDYLGGK